MDWIIYSLAHTRGEESVIGFILMNTWHAHHKSHTKAGVSRTGGCEDIKDISGRGTCQGPM